MRSCHPTNHWALLKTQSHFPISLTNYHFSSIGSQPEVTYCSCCSHSGSSEHPPLISLWSPFGWCCLRADLGQHFHCDIDYCRARFNIDGFRWLISGDSKLPPWWSLSYSASFHFWRHRYSWWRPASGWKLARATPLNLRILVLESNPCCSGKFLLLPSSPLESLSVCFSYYDP